MAEVRQRGIVGWIALGAFVVWNAVMALVVIGSLAAGLRVPDEPAMAAAQSMGARLGLGGGLALWAAGAALLGILVLLTRGNRTGVGPRAD